MPEVTAGLCIPNTEVSQVLPSAVLCVGGDLNNAGIGDFKATTEAAPTLLNAELATWCGCRAGNSC